MNKFHAFLLNFLIEIMFPEKKGKGIFDACLWRTFFNSLNKNNDKFKYDLDGQ